MGVGCPGGSEAIILALSFLTNSSVFTNPAESGDDYFSFQVDFQNAFNAFERQPLLDALCRYLTSREGDLRNLVPWIKWSNEVPAHLQFGPHALKSARGRSTAG